MQIEGDVENSVLLYINPIFMAILPRNITFCIWKIIEILQHCNQKNPPSKIESGFNVFVVEFTLNSFVN